MTRMTPFSATTFAMCVLAAAARAQAPTAHYVVVRAVMA
jgi:hypothetical protein